MCFCITAKLAADVREGSDSDVGARNREVRFTPNSGHSFVSTQRPLCGKSGSRRLPTRSAASRPGKIDRPRIARGLTFLNHKPSDGLQALCSSVR